VAGIVDVHPAHADRPRFLFTLLLQIGYWNLVAGAVGLMALVLLFLLGRLPRVPGGMLVVLLGIEALCNFSDALQKTGKRLFMARLKVSAHHVLARAALPGVSATALIDLSVDDAVRLAMELNQRDSA
jgi:hypothetical protein